MLEFKRWQFLRCPLTEHSDQLRASFSPRRISERWSCRRGAAMMSELLVGVGKSDKLSFAPGPPEELKTLARIPHGNLRRCGWRFKMLTMPRNNFNPWASRWDRSRSHPH